jgi:hypothetical protein
VPFDLWGDTIFKKNRCAISHRRFKFQNYRYRPVTRPGGKGKTREICQSITNYLLMSVSKKRKLAFPQKQTNGSLSKYGFCVRSVKEESRTEENHSAQCPLCDCFLHVNEVLDHSSSCCSSLETQGDSCAPLQLSLGIATENKASKNAFEILREASKYKQNVISTQTRETNLIAYFGLFKQLDGTLLPIFTFSYDEFVSVSEANVSETWRTELTLKRFRLSFPNCFVSGANTTHRDRLANEFGSVKLVVCTNCCTPDNSCSESETPDGVIPKEKENMIPSVAKSMLQKAIRRQQISKAVNIASLMCETHTTLEGTANDENPRKNASKGTTKKQQSTTQLLLELLRRIPIICLEDVSLHPSLPVVVWLMVALSKGFNPPAFLLDVCLFVVADIAKGEFRDFLPKEKINDLIGRCRNSATANECPIFASIDDRVSWDILFGGAGSRSCIQNNDPKSLYGRLNTLACAKRTLLASICIRHSFGGMEHDMNLLDQYGLLWFLRFCSYQCSVGNDTVSFTTAFSCGNVSMLKENDFPKYLAPCYIENIMASCGVWFSMFLSENTAQHRLLVDTGEATNIVFTKTTCCPTETLVPEGIDHICDWGLIPFVIKSCGVHLTAIKESYGEPMDWAELIKEAIWVFRSSINSRQLQQANTHPVDAELMYPQSLYTTLQNTLNKEVYRNFLSHRNESLFSKKRLARLWSVVCPHIVLYCNKKVSQIARNRKTT